MTDKSEPMPIIDQALVDNINKINAAVAAGAAGDISLAEMRSVVREATAFITGEGAEST